MVKSHGFRLASREVLMGLVAGVMLTAVSYTHLTLPTIYSV